MAEKRCGAVGKSAGKSGPAGKWPPWHHTYEQKLSEPKLSSLADRCEEADMVLVYKVPVMNGKCRVDRKDWFELPEPDLDRVRTRAAADDLHIKLKRTNLEIRKYFFTQRVCEKWNALPRQVRAAKSIAAFSREYRKEKYGEHTEGARNQSR
jgi:hypothetical protein